MKTAQKNWSGPGAATAVLCLRDVQEILASIEAREGLIVARKFAAHLHYDRLTALARRGLQGDADNQAACVDKRYMLLLGMEGPEIAAFQEALVSLGFPTAINGSFDEATYRSYWTWLASHGRIGV